jgi:hypothetical protein
VIARLLLLGLATSLIGCTASTETASTSTSVSVSASATPTPAPQACPKNLTAKLLGKNDVPGLTHSIVPGDPQTLVACGPSARVVLTDPGQVQRIADSVNALKLVPQGAVFDCALYVQPVFGFFFNYPNGDVLFVQVGGACNTVSNGHRAAFVGGPVRTQIRHLLASN